MPTADIGDPLLERRRRLAEMWARLSHEAQERVLDRWEQDVEWMLELEEANRIPAEEEQEAVHSEE